MKSRKLKSLIKKMDAVMHEFSEYGAEDSEPDYELQCAMKLAWNRGEVVLPENWQLFTYLMDCTEAERRLNEAAKPILEFLAEAGTLGRDLRDYCWRV